MLFPTQVPRYRKGESPSQINVLHFQRKTNLTFSFLFAGLMLVALSLGWATCGMPGGGCVFCLLVSLVPVP